MLKKNEKVQKALNEFYDIEKNYQPYQVIINFMFGLFSFVGLFILAVPIAALDGEYDIRLFSILSFYFFWPASLMLSNKYTNYQEGPEKGYRNEQRSILKILAFLPVGRWQFFLFCIGKVLKILLIYTGLTLIIRIGISLIFFHTLSIFDFLLPVLACLSLPVLSILGRWVNIISDNSF